MEESTEITVWTVLRRPLLGIALIVLCLYLSFGAYLFFVQRNLIYFPEITRVTPADTNFSILRPDGVVLRGWILNPGRTQALIYFGGNAERIGAERDHLAKVFVTRTVYLLAYRGYGASDGSPNETALFADALALFDQVHARYSRVAVVGRSLGSGVACYVAFKRPVERLALVTPFDSLAAVAQAQYPLLPVRWLILDRYESSRYLPKYHGPLLILRAGQDQLVPVASTNRLMATLSRPPTVVTFAAAGHNNISDDPAYDAALAKFVR